MDKEQQVAAPSDEPQQAPWLPIPSRAISAVEHPCIVKNVDKGILSLGGPVKLSKVRHRSVRTKTGD
jgi:general transcription factor 3C polypeptide 5 (transcription factor C subunit 1)